ncbi:MAG: class I SAM-dependent methyltransferase [Planctomycetia bacterium]|nr:class I SAM-dependent methyltransferase [Planctomycetia bacterium]
MPTPPNPAPSVPAPSLEAVKARQQQTWSSGDFAVIGTRIHASAEALVAAADLSAGWKVLDVATGSGNAALAAARCGCEVVGLDYVPALLARGRERAAAERLDVTFVEGDAERMPFADASFDAVLSIYGVMFAPDAPRAARELLRVVRPGGRIALANWTPQGFVGEMFRVVGRHVPPPAGVTPPTAWGTESRLRELFGDGLASLEVRERDFVFRFRSAAEFVDVFRRFYGPTLKAFQTVGTAGEAALHADLLDLARRFDRNGTGPVAMPAQYLEVIATRR